MRLDALNALPAAAAQAELLRCCGSRAWAEALAARRPFGSFRELVDAGDALWLSLAPRDWLEAFAAHPRIGDLSSLRSKWTTQEQGGVRAATGETLERLAAGNHDYERRFGHVFLICATGKSADEMLAALTKRMSNAPEDELRIAALEQAKITRIRLEKLIQS